MSGAAATAVGHSTQNGRSNMTPTPLYDPRSPDDIDKLNEEYIQRNQPPLISCMLKI